MRPVARAPSQPPGELRRDPRREFPRPLLAGGVSREPGDTEQESDDEIRPGGSAHVEPDRADERWHPERSENHPDRATQDADEGQRSPVPRAGGLGAVEDGAKHEVDAAPDEHRCDQRVEQSLGDVVGQQRPATAPTTDGGAVQATTRQSTRPSRACFRPPAPPQQRRSRCSSRRSERASRHEDHERQTQGPEDEAQHRPDVAGDERRGKS